MATDYDALSEVKINSKYYRDKLIAHNSAYADNPVYLYGNAAEKEYKRLVNEASLTEGSSPTLANLPAGSVIHRFYVAGAWEARGTARTDIVCVYIAPRSVAAVPTDKVNGKDIREFSGD